MAEPLQQEILQLLAAEESARSQISSENVEEQKIFHFLRAELTRRLFTTISWRKEQYQLETQERFLRLQQIYREVLQNGWEEGFGRITLSCHAFGARRRLTAVHNLSCREHRQRDALYKKELLQHVESTIRWKHVNNHVRWRTYMMHVNLPEKLGRIKIQKEAVNGRSHLVLMRMELIHRTQVMDVNRKEWSAILVAACSDKTRIHKLERQQLLDKQAQDRYRLSGQQSSEFRQVQEIVTFAWQEQTHRVEIQSSALTLLAYVASVARVCLDEKQSRHQLYWVEQSVHTHIRKLFQTTLEEGSHRFGVKLQYAILYNEMNSRYVVETMQLLTWRVLMNDHDVRWNQLKAAYLAKLREEQADARTMFVQAERRHRAKLKKEEDLQRFYCKEAVHFYVNTCKSKVRLMTVEKVHFKTLLQSNKLQLQQRREHQNLMREAEQSSVELLHRMQQRTVQVAWRYSRTKQREVETLNREYLTSRAQLELKFHQTRLDLKAKSLKKLYGQATVLINDGEREGRNNLLTEQNDQRNFLRELMILEGQRVSDRKTVETEWSQELCCINKFCKDQAVCWEEKAEMSQEEQDQRSSLMELEFEWKYIALFAGNAREELEDRNHITKAFHHSWRVSFKYVAYLDTLEISQRQRLAEQQADERCIVDLLKLEDLKRILAVKYECSKWLRLVRVMNSMLENWVDMEASKNVIRNEEHQLFHGILLEDMLQQEPRIRAAKCQKFEVLVAEAYSQCEIHGSQLAGRLQIQREEYNYRSILTEMWWGFEAEQTKQRAFIAREQESEWRHIMLTGCEDRETALKKQLKREEEEVIYATKLAKEAKDLQHRRRLDRWRTEAHQRDAERRAAKELAQQQKAYEERAVLGEKKYLLKQAQQVSQQLQERQTLSKQKQWCDNVVVDKKHLQQPDFPVVPALSSRPKVKKGGAGQTSGGVGAAATITPTSNMPSHKLKPLVNNPTSTPNTTSHNNNDFLPTAGVPNTYVSPITGSYGGKGNNNNHSNGKGVGSTPNSNTIFGPYEASIGKPPAGLELSVARTESTQQIVEMMEALNTSAMALVKLGKHEEARHHLSRAEGLGVSHNKDDIELIRSLSLTYNNMGCLEKLLNRHNSAVSLLSAALKVEQKANTMSPHTLVNLCAALTAAGRYMDSVKHARMAVQLVQSGGNASREVAIFAWQALAVAQHCSGNPQEVSKAEESLNYAKRLSALILGEDHPTTLAVNASFQSANNRNTAVHTGGGVVRGHLQRAAVEV